MEDTTDMEVENPNPNSVKRFGLRNFIQTNFGDDYVFQIVPKDDWTSMAVSLSTNSVKLYSPITGQYQGECKGHSATINQIAFSVPSTPHILHSCSSDATIRAWDTRTFRQVSCIRTGSNEEIFSFSFGGSTDNLLAAGSKSQIFFWDWRNMKQVACLEESHVDDVTQVMNTGTSIGKVGFFGENRKLWCLTHIETLSIWDWKEARNVTNIQEARSLASDCWTLDNVDYFVDCHYSGQDERLWVIGGTQAGALGYFPVNYATGEIGAAEAILGGGHTSVIRSVLPMSNMKVGSSQTQGIFGWTGGEDGRLCCWLSDDSTEINRSWTSSALAIKSSKNRKKNRHIPY
ncbi:WD repeat-containing protein GTS1 isoform X2 [Euphorbia lathyris]|uniref:WD repeat-containing protein GTS1 isoform X2 n=1 Tax=Euphorbia lathyris TaxID=212925 RepID=UPI0033139CA2